MRERVPDPVLVGMKWRHDLSGRRRQVRRHRSLVGWHGTVETGRTIGSRTRMVGKLYGDRLACGAVRRNGSVEHLDGAVRLRAEVKADKPDTLRQSCSNITERLVISANSTRLVTSRAHAF